MALRFRTYDQFEKEILKNRSGPMVSAVEDMADEMYHLEIQEEPESLWDDPNADEE